MQEDDYETVHRKELTHSEADEALGIVAGLEAYCRTYCGALTKSFIPRTGSRAPFCKKSSSPTHGRVHPFYPSPA